ncbi:hypothetical protein ACFL5Z_17940 [Planctomycetota bacterium]
MGHNNETRLFVRDIQQWLAEDKLYHQARIDKITAMEKELVSMPSELSITSAGTTVSDEPKKIMIANGRRLTQEAMISLNKDDFDVILDMTTHLLRYRQYPEKHTKLMESNLRHVGPHRIKILEYMLEHPSKPICWENAPMALGNPDEIRAANTITQTICLLRKALGTPGRDNPYISGEPAWELSSQSKALAYRLNPKWQYLLIKWPRKKS